MVLLVKLVLSSDNAIVIGMATATFAPDLRNEAMVFGIAAAMIFRISLAALTHLPFGHYRSKADRWMYAFLRLLPVVDGFVRRRRPDSRTTSG